MAQGKEHEPTKETEQLVKLCVIGGIPLEQIAKALGVTRKTLSKHYKTIIQTAALAANAAVIGRLFEHTKTNPASCMFWLKTRAGWKESEVLGEEEPQAFTFRETKKGERITLELPDE